MTMQQDPVKIIHAALVQKAINRETTTYGELAPLVGLPTSGNHLASTMGGYLLKILQWCQKRNQPQLTSLVVKAGSGAQSGIPGNGFWIALNLTLFNNEERREVTHAFQQAVYEYYDVDAQDTLISGVTLFADTLAAVRKAVNRSTVTVKLDPQDPDPATSVRYILEAFFEANKSPMEIATADFERGLITLRPSDVIG